MQERVQVLVRPTHFCRIDAPIARSLSAFGTNVSVARASVVNPNPLVREAAKALIERLSRRLAEQVPQRDVYRRGGAHLYPAAREAEILVLQRPSMAVQLERRLAEQERRYRFMELRLDCSRAKEGFAQADHSLVRMHMDPQEIRELTEPDRLKGCELHGVSPTASGRTHAGRPQ